MAKSKTLFFCQNCGAQSSQWVGRCSSCGEWNTFVEEVIQREDENRISARGIRSDGPVPVHEVNYNPENRVKTFIHEFDRVLGGGIVAGSLILVGGEPGIGKSTLLLQVAMQMQGSRILYVTGEESSQQVRMRAERLGKRNEECYILTETSVTGILSHAAKLKPSLVVIDSIQTLYTDNIDSSAGSVSQIRECAARMQQYSKESHVPVILIGHITKDGSIAGPKLLEHMVDTVLQFEGERNYGYRILRSVKNRFGSTSELGIFEMLNTGLREVTNPSEILLTQHDEMVSGIALASTIEGQRPLLIEVQALVSNAVFSAPQRSATGFDLRRMNMLLAVLEKRGGFRTSHQDVFLNIAGGIKVDDPAIDLGVLCAVVSSLQDIPIDPKICFAAEVSLSGEIRPVSRIEQRIAEAEKLGLEQIFISKFNVKGLDDSRFSITTSPFTKLEQVFERIFG